jgi:hypothetical protein
MKRMVLAALVVAVMVGAVMCGGTTGTEDLPAVMTSNPAALDASIDSAVDATLGDTPDAGFFDVEITYTERTLPDVAAPTVTGDAAAGYPWPNCPPWVPVTFRGLVAPSYDMSYALIPAQYDDAGDVLVDDAGRAVPFPDGSACATYPWLGSTAADSCVANGATWNFSPLPVCNWCVDAGVTLQGPLSGQDRYGVCAQLYECMTRTGCGQNHSPGYCLCGLDEAHCDAGGPCALEELSALESLSDPASLAMTTSNYTGIDPQTPGNCGRALNAVFLTGVNGGCFTDAGQ